MYRQELSPEQRESRAKNAVAELLFRELIVPLVFVDAKWPISRNVVDVLAVDRGGSGEVHAVKVMVGTEALANIDKVVSSLMRIPAHFKYIAVFGNKSYLPERRLLYAPDGMGRIGIIHVKEDRRGNLSAEFRIRPERFKFDATFKRVDDFTKTHRPYIEIRA